MHIPASVLQSLGVGRATISRKVEAGIWIAKRGKRQGSYGQPEMLIQISSLSPDLQARCLKALTRESLTRESPVGVETSAQDKLAAFQEALARFTPPRYSAEQRDAVERRCVQLAKVSEQYAVLSRRKKATASAVKQLRKQAVCGDPIYLAMYPRAAKKPSANTITQWARWYRQKGMVVFVPKPQTLSPAKDRRFKVKIPIAAQEWLRLNWRSYAWASLTRFGEKWMEACARNGWEVPFTTNEPNMKGSCYPYLYRWRQAVPAAAETLALEGYKGLEAKFAYIVRDYEDLVPREAWTMDWKQMDIACWRPATRSGEPAKLVRLWLCAVFDLASDAIFGWYLDTRPNARGVTLAYLDAIGNGEWKSEPGFEMLRGIQRGSDDRQAFVLWDNGKDYRAGLVEGQEITVQEITVRGFCVESDLESTLTTYQVGLAPDLGIRVRHAKPFNAKAKLIERWFGTLGQWEKTMPGYCGGRPEEKPHFFAAARRIHERWMKRKPAKAADVKQLPPTWRAIYDETGTPFFSEERLRQEWIKELLNYLQTPRKGLLDERGLLSPIGYLDQYASAPHMLTETSYRALLYVPRPQPVSVINGEVIVRWGGEPFVYREVASDISDGGFLLELPQKTKCEFRYDPNSIGDAMLLSGGGPICRVEQKTLLGYNARQCDIEESMREKKAVRTKAEEFYQSRGPQPDWRDEAVAREQSNVIPLQKAVGAEDFDDEAEAPSKPASVTVPTRFDRKPRRGLAMVPPTTSTQEDDDEWNDDDPLPTGRGTDAGDDDWVE